MNKYVYILGYRLYREFYLANKKLFKSSYPELKPFFEFIDSEEVNQDSFTNLYKYLQNKLDNFNYHYELVKALQNEASSTALYPEIVATLKNELATLVTNSAIDANSPIDVISNLKKIEIRDSLQDDNFINHLTFDDLNWEEGGTLDPFNPIYSFYQPLNNRVIDSAGEGYPTSGLFCICAPTKCGKSIFIMNEAINLAKQGLKTHIYQLGEITEHELKLRLMCSILNKSRENVTVNLRSSLEKTSEFFKSLKGNLTFSVQESNQISADQLVQDIKNNDFDVVLIDYDANISSIVGNLYEGSGNIYKMLDRAKTQCLIFIASQANKSWNYSTILGRAALNESSMKGFVIDGLITISCPYQTAEFGGLGYICSDIQRAQGRKLCSPYYRDITGHFHPITAEAFDELSDKFTNGIRIPLSEQELNVYKEKLGVKQDNNDEERLAEL